MPLVQRTLKSRWELELARVTVMEATLLDLLSALTVTTPTTLTIALLMATTARRGLAAGSSSALARGTVGAAEVIMAAATTAVADTMEAVTGAAFTIEVRQSVVQSAASVAAQ